MLRGSEADHQSDDPGLPESGRIGRAVHPWVSAPATDAPGASEVFAACTALRLIWQSHGAELEAHFPGGYWVLNRFLTFDYSAVYSPEVSAAIEAQPSELPPFLSDLLARSRAFLRLNQLRESFDIPSDAEKHYLLFERMVRESSLDNHWTPSVRGTPVVSTRETAADTQPEHEGADIESDASRETRGRRASELRLRQLLPEWTYAFDEDQLRLVANIASSASAPIRRADVRKLEQLVQEHSAWLLQAALLTGRSLRAATRLRVLAFESMDAAMRVVEDLPENMLLRIAGEGRHRSSMVFFRPPGARRTKLLLPIERVCIANVEECIDFELHELLPLPPREMLPLIQQHLASRAGLTVSQFERYLRYALPRAMFACNANRAAIEFLCGPPREEAGGGWSRKHSSLAAYVHPDSPCVRDAFASSVQALLWPDHPASSTSTALTDGQAGRHVRGEMLSAVTTELRQRIAGAATPTERHNAFAMYVAALLICSTGHRKSQYPFHFAFSIDEEALVAFLADKQTVGSEARFVPITQMVAEQLREYRRHLVWLLKVLRRDQPNLAAQIAQLANTRDGDGPLVDTPLSLLFTVEGNRLTSIRTDMVDEALCGAASALGLEDGPRFNTGTLRRNLATFLANQGLSGMQVEMFLGHNPAQHIFGAASCWIPLDQFDKVRPLIERYLAANGFAPVEAHWCEGVNPPKTPAPAFDQSAHGYEGRRLSHDAASDRAREAVLAEIPPEDLEDEALELTEEQIAEMRRAIENLPNLPEPDRKLVSEKLEGMLRGWTLPAGIEARPAQILAPLRLESARHAPPSDSQDDGQRHLALACEAVVSVLGREKLERHDRIVVNEESMQAIRARVNTLLADDPAARDKVLTQLATMAAKWRRNPQYRITSVSLNLARCTPGVVDIRFGRHLAMANAIASRLPSVLTDYLDSKIVSIESRLATMAVLMVTTEAVLNMADVLALLDAVQDGEVGEFEHQPQLRAEVESRRAIYTRTLDMSHKLAAAYVGYRKARQAEDRVVSHHVIRRNADELVQCLVGPRHSLNFEQLLAVMRPYWFLRLPGSAYASAVGEFDCTAPSDHSMALLLGQPSPELPIQAPSTRKARPQLDVEIEQACALSRDLLGRAYGIREKHQTSSRGQRRRLRNEFNEAIDPPLLEMTYRQPVVDVWVTFLRFMLEEGGFRKKRLSFGTLMNYQDRLLRRLLHRAWGRDLLGFSSEEFDDLYSEIHEAVGARDRHDVDTVLRLFHHFLRSTFGVARCAKFVGSERPKREARDVVLPVKVLASALQRIQEEKSIGSSYQLGSAALLAAMAGWGVRTYEPYGLRQRDLLGEEVRALRIRRNASRSLKTLERTVPVFAVDAPALDRVNTLRGSRRADWRRLSDPVNSLFADPKDQRQLLSWNELSTVANWAIKTASGDREAIPYSLRHGFATGVLSHLLITGDCLSPIARRIGESLALPENCTKALATLRASPAMYPFQPDRLGMWMGHAGVSTLATTYWHGAWWTLGEYAERQASKDLWHVGTYAGLMDLSRASVSKRRDKVGESSEALRYRRTVEYFVASLELKPLVAQGQVPVGDNSPNTGVRTLSIEMVDTLLMMRSELHAEAAPALVGMAQKALGLDRTTIERFVEAYDAVGDACGFVDFQPSAEDAPQDGNKASLQRGHRRRREFLARIAEKGEEETFSSLTAALVQRWVESVNADEPFLVCRSGRDLAAVLRWLIDLGYEANTIDVLAHRSDETGLNEATALGVSIVPRAERVGRLARVSKAEAEYGVSVRGARSRPNGRDLHRTLFGLAIYARISTAGAVEEPKGKT